MKTQAADRNIPTLDGWRAVAILMVIICHGMPRDSALAPLRIFGTHGVYIFFGISGFLITTRLLDEEARRGAVSLPEFYLRRAFRILPPALFFLCAVALLGWVGLLERMSPKEWAVDAFFLQSYVGHFPGRSISTMHFWSLAVEEHFYLLFPSLLVFAGSRRLRRIVPVLLVAVPLWRWVDDRFVDLHGRAFPGIFADYRTDRICDLLLFGCGLALLLRDERWRSRLKRWLSVPALSATAVVFALVVWKQPRGSLTIEGLCVAAFLAGTVLNPRSIYGRVLDSAPAQLIGRLSYSIYLWQQLFFVTAYQSPQWHQRFPINALLAAGCALASYHLLEQPMIALGRRVIERRRRRLLQPDPLPLAGGLRAG
ncbi:MAG TPA: acyltransferase [Myxococcaceae bacterium]|nr:acyltransferase [Myxococcaceae bacterium]